MRPAIGVGISALWLYPAVALPQPDVAEILKKVTETYKVSQYEFVANGKSTDDRTGKSLSFHFHFAFRGPDNYRMEGVVPGFGAQEGLSGDLDNTLMVDDGTALWFYLSGSNQYGSIPTSALTADAPGDLGDARPEAMDYFVMWRYRGASDRAKDAKLLREEVLDAGKGRVECYVISVQEKRGGEYTWWVDKTRYRILREDAKGSSVVFTTIKLDAPLPDELFKFTPPPGAQKLEVHQ